MFRLILMGIVFIIVASIIFSLLGTLLSILKLVIACGIAFFVVRFGYNLFRQEHIES
jgi:hypothetical protein